MGTEWALSLYLLQHLHSELQLVQLLLLGRHDLRVSLGEALLLEVAKWGRRRESALARGTAELIIPATKPCQDPPHLSLDALLQGNHSDFLRR